MSDKNLWTKVGLVVLILGMSIYQIWDYQTQLKPGIDLGGGYSATFEIDDTGSTDADLAVKVMNILKQRIDPGSTRNLVWRPIGRNRLEIQMPLARSNKEAKDAYESARAQLLSTALTESQLRAALLLPPAQRDVRFSEMSRGVPSREPLFAELARLDDAYDRLSQVPDTNPAETQPAASRPASTQPAGSLHQVLQDRQKVITSLLETNLNIQGLLDRLELGRKNPKRAEELEAVKKRHPDLAAKITQLTEAYDKWSQHKSMLEDPSDLLRMLRGAGVLEFRILATRNSQNPEMLQSAPTKPEYNEPVAKYIEALGKRGPRPDAGDNYAWFKVAKPRENTIVSSNEYVTKDYLGVTYVLAHATPDMGLLNDKNWSLVRAARDVDQMGRPAVRFELDTKGGDRFAVLTETNLHRPLCIFLDNEAISAATIQSRISTNGQITGNFSEQEVAYLVNTLEAGALPARLKEVPIQERNVGPALGETNRRMGFISVTVSLLAVIAFMVVYYAYNGGVADVALLMNLFITLGAMSFLQATFTLPGIAGLILTVGMAVDANVLIFERMREELQRGVSARMAVKLGYERAFSAIFDGNVTTIISAAILYWIGSEEIKGFGLTLSLGLAISMFTALFVTRLYYHVMIPVNLNHEEVRKAWMMPVILAVIAAVILGLGYITHRTPDAREDSNLWGLGKLAGVLALTAAAILASMWLFRGLYKAIGHQKANTLPMMKLMAAPTIDWMGKYKKFWVGSCVVIGLGLILVASKGADLLDIEFTGGTDVQVELKDQYKDYTDEQLAEHINGKKSPTSVEWLRSVSQEIKNATVTPAGDRRFLVALPNKSLTTTQLQAVLMANRRITAKIGRNGIVPVEGGVAIEYLKSDQVSVPDLAETERLVRQVTPEYLSNAVADMNAVRIQSVTEGNRKAFDIVTRETTRALVAESLLASSMHDLLEISQPIEATLVKDADRAPEGIFPINPSASRLSEVIGGQSPQDISRFKGGLVIQFTNLRPPVTEGEIERRLKQMRLQPDFESTGIREAAVFGLGDPVGNVQVPDDQGKPVEKQLYNHIAVAVVDPVVIYDPDRPNESWLSQVAGKELDLAKAALASSQSLQRVTQFAPQVANEAAQKALIAVILSFIAIAVYLWVRFGSLDFGISGIIALYHDVAVALAAIVACHYIHDTWFGRLLLLEDFRIDLNVIAALLTIVGYSINDTIVIFDRIRENRGRLGQISPTLINDSLNQTLSRTVLTAFTVFMVVLIMYFFGGEGIHGFAFVMIIGSISGTYSTLAIATPMVQHPRAMWITTIAITAVTMVGITWSIDTVWLRSVVVLVVVGLSALMAYKQLAAIRHEQALPSGRRPATV